MTFPYAKPAAAPKAAFPLRTALISGVAFAAIGAAAWVGIQRTAPTAEQQSAQAALPQDTTNRDVARTAILRNAGSDLVLLDLNEVESLAEGRAPQITRPEFRPAQARSSESGPSREAVRLAILQNAGSNLELLALDEVEELNANLTAPKLRSTLPAGIRTQTQPTQLALASTGGTTADGTVNLVAPRETVQTAEADCVTDLRAVAARSTIYFTSGGARLDANGLNILRQVGQAAQDCPAALVHVTGHTDSSGTDAANLALSWERADNTVTALSGMGIDTSRFEPVGFGARAPFSQGDSADPNFDRRVEFVVLEKASN